MSEVSDVSQTDVVSCVVDELENFKKSKINRESVYKPRAIKLKHSEVPEYIYSHIQPVDFRSEAGLIEDKDKLNIRHFLFTCIEKIRETVDETGLGLCYRDGLVYMYNGEYWKRFPIPSFQSFLSKSAVKMGVTKFLGGIYSFKEQLAKQFMSVAHMDDFDDDAFYRRFLIIPFDVTIPKEKQDKQLARKIINKELPGVLNWVLEGLKRLVDQRGFTESEQADAVLNDYRVQGDSVALFVDEMGYRPSNESIPLTELHSEYSFFCRNRNLVPETLKIFSQRLKNQGIAVKRKSYGMSVLIEKEFTESPTFATLATSF